MILFEIFWEYSKKCSTKVVGVVPISLFVPIDIGVV